MRKCTIIILILMGFHEVFSQNILNHSFENHNKSDCAYNLNNLSFNSSMQNVNSFGTTDQLDIQNNGCDVSPQLGNWCIGLASFPLGGHDAITLELTSPLSIGTLYELNFWTYNNTTYVSTLGQPQDSIQIGLSTSNSSYGQKIYTSFPQLDTWQIHTIQFVADSNYSFFSVNLKEDFGSATWIQVDNFSISIPISVGTEHNSIQNNSSLNLYPNPASTQLIIDKKSINPKNEIKIIGVESQIVKVFNDGGNVLDISDLPNGVYILELSIKGDVERKKFIKHNK